MCIVSILYRAGADSAYVAIGQVGFPVPLIKAILNQRHFPLARWVVLDVDSSALQALCDISRNYKSILTHIAQHPLSRHAPQPAAVFFQVGE